MYIEIMRDNKKAGHKTGFYFVRNEEVAKKLVENYGYICFCRKEDLPEGKKFIEFHKNKK